MRLLIWFAAGLGLVGQTAAFAAAVSYEFAIPEFTRTVSIGVYDESGRLVRKLAQQAAIQDFQIGLNGLIGKWDGRNDVGEVVPSGVYHLRGFALGELKVDGIAFHFNDWAAEWGDETPITQLFGMAASSHGGFYALAETPDGRRLVFYYRPDAGLVWKRELPEGPAREPAVIDPLRSRAGQWLDPVIAADGANVAVVNRGRLTFLGALSGHEIGSAAVPNFVHALAFRNGTLTLADGAELLNFIPGAAEAARPEKSPATWRSLSALGDAWIGADWEGTVWQSAGGSWQKLPLEGGPRIISLAAAGEQSFWAIASEPAAVVGEFSTKGEFLKNLQTEDGQALPQLVSAVAGQNEVYLLARSADRQQLIGIRRVNPPDAAATWEIFLDKNIRNSANFGLSEGAPVAEVSTAPDLHFTLRLRDTMTQTRQNVPLEIAADSSGVTLRNADGLALDSLIEANGVRRIAIESGQKPGVLRLFVGKPGVVEEFAVSGLSQISLLDVGEVEWRDK